MTDTSSRTAGQDVESFDPAAQGDWYSAHAMWTGIRRAESLPRTSCHGGMYLVGRYGDAQAALRDFHRFSSASGTAISSLQHGYPLLPLEVDPPAQHEYRRLLNRFFTREAVAAHEDEFRSMAVMLAERLAGEMVSSGSGDAVTGFATPFPIMVSLALLGIPADEARLIEEMVNRIFDIRALPESVAEASAAFSDYIGAYLASRRESAPRDDVVGAMLTEQVGGSLLSHQQQESVLKLLLFGGFTTTTFAIAALVRWLALAPEEQDRLRADRTDIDAVTDDIVRWCSPGTYLGRTVAEDTELGGQRLIEGDRLLVCVGAANRDSEQFDDADSVRADRHFGRHLGFGFGPHRCIGIHLARLELRLAATELLTRIPAFTLATDPRERWVSGEVAGLAGLQISPR